jgi:hypothetical protein
MGKNNHAGAVASTILNEFRKIVHNNRFFNVKISSNRCHLAGSYPVAARR